MTRSLQSACHSFSTTSSSLGLSSAEVPGNAFHCISDPKEETRKQTMKGIQSNDPLSSSANHHTTTASGNTSFSSFIYEVPVLTSRLVGRQQDLLFLWQQLLRGKHTLLVTGVDGIGKSSLCAEFCDRASRSGRFSCIRWLSAGNRKIVELKEDLRKLFSSMAGRRERDVLLVLDDVPSDKVEETLSILPTHEQLYIVLNTSGEAHPHSNNMRQSKPGRAHQEEEVGEEKKKQTVEGLASSPHEKAVASLPSSSTRLPMEQSNADGFLEGWKKSENILHAKDKRVTWPVMLSLAPLLPEEVNNFHACPSTSKAPEEDALLLREVYHCCTRVPLLLEVALPLLQQKCFETSQAFRVFLRENDVLDPSHDQGFSSPSVMKEEEGDDKCAKKVTREVSISKLLSVLLKKSLAVMEKEWPNARERLAVLACLEVEDISEAVASLVCTTGERDNPLSTSHDTVSPAVGMNAIPRSAAKLPMEIALAVKFGILRQKWSTAGGYRMHSTVAAILRQQYIKVGEERFCSLISSAANCVGELWPRRWRGLKVVEARSLTRHTNTLLSHFDNVSSSLQAPPLSSSSSSALSSHPSPAAVPSLMYALDRSAQFLAYYARQDLPLAGNMWHGVFRQYLLLFPPDRVSPSASSPAPGSHFAHLLDLCEAVRIGTECGRLLHYLHDKRAYYVLEVTRQWCVQAHGVLSKEYGLLLSYLAPYLLASKDNLDLLEKGITALEYALTVDSSSLTGDVLGIEEAKMYREALFVVLLRKGQVLQECGHEVPTALWGRLEEVEREIDSFSKDKRKSKEMNTSFANKDTYLNKHGKK